MRQIITVNQGDVNLKERKEEINNLVKKLSEYLDFYPVGKNPTKYEIMGPIGKIIAMAKNRKNTPEFIKARALRIHEMNRISGYVSSEAVKVMQEAVDELMKFRKELSPIELSKIMEMIDYEVYFDRRKKKIEELEQIRKEFIEYLKKRYSANLNNLRSRWEKANIPEWDDIKFPSKTGKYFQSGNDTQKRDIKSFWEQHKDLEKKIVEIEEINND